MNNYLQLLKIEHLEGGGYNVDSIIKAIQTFSSWALRVGIAAAGVSLIVGFILYAVVDVDRKAQVKQRIIQTMFGIVGIILAIFTIFVVACGNKQAATTATTAPVETASALKEVTVAASPVPHAEILYQVVDDMKALGYDLKVQEFSDYVLPYTAVNEGRIMANYFQHKP